MSQLHVKQKGNLRWLRPVAACFVTLALISCEDHRAPLPGQSIQSNSPKPDWGPTITPQNLAVIEELGRLSPTPLNLLPPPEARKQPSFKDAVNSLLDKNKIPRPTANVTVSQRMIPGAGGVPIRIVVYTPNNAPAGPLPVIVYYHGGGWVIGSPEVYEYSTLALAEEVNAVVVSVDYRLAPENKFPTAHNDAFAAYQWVKNNAATINGNPAKVAVAGESAGGNMAITVAMMARDQGIPPVHILSVFPVANNYLFTDSYNKYANAKPLNRPLVEYFTANYFNTPADGDSPLISLVDDPLKPSTANLSGLAPTTIIAAEIDPLQTEGMQLRDKLQALNVPVTYRLYAGVTHEFFGMYAILPEAQQAQELAATQLRQAFK
ncbi:alpha/beta hydrolase [Spirosoma areae]